VIELTLCLIPITLDYSLAANLPILRLVNNLSRQLDTMPNTGPPSPALTKLLAAEGFTPDDDDVSKEDALRWAALWMKPALAKLLIDEGVDVLSRDKESQRTALHIAAA
jgi:ankyrin repeat protein